MNKLLDGNEMRILGDLCNFKNGKGIKKESLIEGDYPVIGGGQKPMGYHNKYNTDENTILCSSSGAYSGYISKYKEKVWASDCFAIVPKTNLIDNDYLYYYLKTLQGDIYKYQTGSAQPHVYSRNLETMKIYLPIIENQKEIVEYCKFNCNLIEQLNCEINKNRVQACNFIMRILKN